MKWIVAFLLSINSALAMQPTIYNSIAMHQNNQEKYYQFIATTHNSTQPLGWINYVPVANTPGRWMIAYLAVAKEHRTKGIASALFKACFNDLQKKNAQVTVWDCSPQEEHQSVHIIAAIYESMIQKHIIPIIPGTLAKTPTPWGTIKMTYTINAPNTTSFSA